MSLLLKIAFSLCGLAACFLFTACRVEVPPIKQAYVTDLSAGETPDAKKEIAPAHLPELAAFLGSLGDGWSYEINDPAPVGKRLTLIHANGRKTTIQFYQATLYSGNYRRDLASAESTALSALLAPTKLLPTFGR